MDEMYQRLTEAYADYLSTLTEDEMKYLNDNDKLILEDDV